MEAILVAAAVGVAAALVTTLLAHRAGLGLVSRAADEQQDRLVEALQRRVGLLEDENKRLADHVRTLENDNALLLKRVSDLEHAIATKVVP